MDWSFLNEQYFSNPLRSYIACVTIIILGLIFSRYIAKLASKLSYQIFKQLSHSRFLKEFTKLFTVPFSQLLNVVIVYIALNQLTFPEEWNLCTVNEFGVRWALHAVFIIALITVFTKLLLKTAEFMEFVHHNLEDSKISKDLASFLKELTRVLIYTFCFFAILSQAFEVNILTLVASLGIGGLAIALAAQDTLANLIGSFIIYLDKPFQVGEIIELGEIKGVVEKIGFRTTRIRTMDRTLLIVPNKKIIDSNLNNITQSTQRRIKFSISLTYQSKPEDILMIIEEIKKAIILESPLTAEEMMVRFTDFDTSSLTLLVNYFVNSNDYEILIEVKERINLKIIEIVKKQGCQFAYPSQTVFIGQNDNGNMGN